MTATTQPGAPARNPSAHLPQIPAYPDQASTPAQPEQERFLRLPEVRHITGLSKTVLYEMMQNDEFPPNYRISLKASGWKYSEVMQWMDSRPRAGGAV
ncbi:MAG: AlpA family phage regulatory protein [Thiothrix sp.]